ncbi:MAG: nucleotidyltransferase domain-containing protein [Bacillus sp. (in: Bacteria)]|nr:nucleotidyltransferase domain-containing protein [Bacillus sp. (in: firmicutes)]MCM1426758.1 nucleotidyltransferase domain-containing protein [Eubacterium sp.]
MSDNLSVLLERYREAVTQILGKQLSGIILYGSYARGDFKKDSDIDIMILADVLPEEVSSYADKIYDITYDFEIKYGMEINPSIQSVNIYEQWKNVYPFFMNIEKDGIAV